ncbi:MAG: toll/interleukin-1 receptor domain-containing protein [Actinobacteria bacterium]|nr:toll/interleukin-1 receptor domain-containing protein [Actinomycetota bacterium]
MVDIFLSYAREDKTTAHRVAEAFESQGWSVWWDREIVIGTAFEHEIEKALDGAKCVVVLWSKDSVGSDWVRTEAAEGARRKILTPAFIKAVVPPLSFRGLHTADLSRWGGDPADPVFQDLCRAVESKAGPPGAPPSSQVTPPSPRAWATRNRGPLLGAVGAAIALLAAVGIALALSDGDDDGGGTAVEKSLTVPARAVWTDTGIDVEPGAILEFSAQGEISGDVGAPDQVGKKSGPDGIPGTVDNPTYKSVTLAVAHDSVIGKIGEDGEPYPITARGSKVADRAGRLFVGVNDTDACNNGGAFTVQVRISPEDAVVAGDQPPPTTLPSCV